MARSLAGLKAAFSLLLEAKENRSAQLRPRTKRTAVPILLASGLPKPDLRLLLENGYLEISPKNRFQQKTDMKPEEMDGQWIESAHVRLTLPGAALAGQILYPLSDDRSHKRGFPDLSLPASPEWNEELQVLSWGGKVIERFRRPAPNLVALIHALGKSNWAVWTPNPFRATADRSGQSLLHDSIKNWKRSPIARFIRLHGDGSGTGFLWER